MRVLWYIIAFLVLSAIILCHELGHFLLAKKNGIKVNEFCLGFGPTIFSFQPGETKFALRAFPLGGACMMEGEDDESEDERSFQKKSVWARISVVAAGPIFNFIMAFICSVVLIGCIGYSAPTVTSVAEGYPAEEAGLAEGDEIVRIDNKNIHLFGQVSLYLLVHQGEETELTYVRDGEEYTVDITPMYSEESGMYLYGVTGGERVRTGPFETLRYGAYNMRYWVDYTFGSLKMLITHQVTLDDMSGPVGIVKVMGDGYAESSADGAFYVVMTMLNIIVLISVNLGILNLLPIPALDGGRLVFLIIEAIRRKRVLPEREAMVHFVGLVCLFGFMILIMFNDVFKLFDV